MRDQSIDGTSQPKPHMISATIWARTIVTTSGAAAGRTSVPFGREQQQSDHDQLQEHDRLQLMLVRQPEILLQVRMRKHAMPINSRPNDAMIENSPSTVETPSSRCISSGSAARSRVCCHNQRS